MPGRMPEYGERDQARWRKKIRVSAIIDKLNDHILGKTRMTGTMVRAAEILLRKVQPDLLATAIQTDIAALPLLKIVRRDQPGAEIERESNSEESEAPASQKDDNNSSIDNKRDRPRTH